MTNKHRPDYINKADYNTNSPSYYHDLARKQKLIQLLAEKIWEYENTLNESLEQIEKRLTDYILENDLLLNERLENWDKRIEEMPEEMRSLFVTWLNDGTLDQIINHDVLGNKADQSELDKTNDFASEAFRKNWARNDVQVNNKPLLTIVDDDGYKEVLTELKPIADSLGVPITVAACVNYPAPDEDLMTKEDLLMLQDSGWEIASHTVTHPNLRILSEEEIDYELKESKKILSSWGLDIKNFVAPYGSNDNAKVRDVASRYYNVSAEAGSGVNRILPYRNHRLERVPMGSFTPEGQNTLEFYKSKVDEAIQHNGWVIFMTHVWNDDHDTVQTSYVKQTIEYALSEGVEVVNLQEGFERKGNVLEVEGGFSVNVNGQAYHPKGAINGVTGYLEVDKNTPPSYFNENYRKKVIYSNIHEERDGVHYNDGFLITYNLEAIHQMVQMFIPYDSTDQYIRRPVTGSNSWTEFTPVSKIVMDIKKHTNSTPISSFEEGRITYSKVAYSDDAGFPEGAGSVITYNVITDNGYPYQEFVSYDTGIKYLRVTKNDGTWSGWKRYELTPI